MLSQICEVIWNVTDVRLFDSQCNLCNLLLRYYFYYYYYYYYYYYLVFVFVFVVFVVVVVFFFVSYNVI